VQVLDDKNVRRRFRASNYQSTTRVKPFICTMPMRLDEGWNQIQFNLSDFTRRAYGTNYIETLRVQIHANCRIRRCHPLSAIAMCCLLCRVFLPAAVGHVRASGMCMRHDVSRLAQCPYFSLSPAGGMLMCR
jgi:hypothetical protein